jgi:hypothetical protein
MTSRRVRGAWYLPMSRRSMIVVVFDAPAVGG